MTSETERIWRDVAGAPAAIADALGRPIDPGIRETVIALNALGMSTVASCEGHLDHGLAAPWIVVGDPTAMPYAQQAAGLLREGKREQAEESHMTAKRLNLAQRRVLLDLLDAFYAGRTVAAARRLIINPAEWSGIARLISQGADLQEIATPEERAQKLAEYQDEMRA